MLKVTLVCLFVISSLLSLTSGVPIEQNEEREEVDLKSLGLTDEELSELPSNIIELLLLHQKQEKMIIGGVEVNPKFKYPWTADLFVKASGTGRHFCGGSLINETWILTAAHCSAGLKPSVVGAQVHRHDLTKTAASENGVVRDIKRIVVHSKYNPNTLANDVALWQLSSPIKNIALVQMDKNGGASTVGAMSTVVGWGDTREGGGSSSVLREVDVPIISNTKCNEQYGGGITNSMICAGYDQGGKDACQGDSGGPLFVNKNSKPIQVGIVSWGHGCARPKKSGVYARVSFAYDFIQKTING